MTSYKSSPNEHIGSQTTNSGGEAATQPVQQAKMPLSEMHKIEGQAAQDKEMMHQQEEKKNSSDLRVIKSAEEEKKEQCKDDQQRDGP